MADKDEVEPTNESDPSATDDSVDLVGAGAPVRKRAGATSVGSSADRASERKGRVTPKQHQVAETKRTGPVTFVKESVGELRKVVYPTGPQLARYFVVVLVFVLFIIGVVSVLDLAFGAAMLWIFG